VTMCTYNRIEHFGKIVKEHMQLNNAGQMINSVLNEISKHYYGIFLDQYIVMPNHIHMIIIIINSVGTNPRVCPLITRVYSKQLNNGQAQWPVPTGKLSLSNIIKRVKSLTTKKYIDGVKNNGWVSFNKHLWQRSFYDHIIRNEISLHKIRAYIINNPLTWQFDIENINE